MATITTTTYASYIGGTASDHGMVGYASSSNYCVRFQFTSPATGASSVTISGNFSHSGGSTAAPKWYITDSATSHTNAGASSTAHGTLTMTLSSGVYVGTGTASIVLKPNTTYYLWFFPSVAEYGIWGHYKSFTITTSGGAGLVYIDNGTSWDAYQVYIDNGTSWDLYMPYIDNGSSWDLYT